jgi:hypothetical protein
MKDLSKIGQVLSEENKTGEVCVIRLVSACAVPNAQHAPSAIAELARLASKAKSETARIAAIRELLDRGYGRSRQAVEVSAPAADPLEGLFRELDALSRNTDRYKQYPKEPA